MYLNAYNLDKNLLRKLYFHFTITFAKEFIKEKINVF